MTIRYDPKSIVFFLYGTLRPGASQHGLIAPYILTSMPARAWGRLYQVAGDAYPALELPEAAIRARGTADPEADAALASRLAPTRLKEDAGDWGWVLGDLVALREPHLAVPPMDAYEDFQPGAMSLFNRVLITVGTGENWALAWTYTKAPGTDDRRIRSGAWPSDSNIDDATARYVG